MPATNDRVLVESVPTISTASLPTTDNDVSGEARYPLGPPFVVTPESREEFRVGMEQIVQTIIAAEEDGQRTLDAFHSRLPSYMPDETSHSAPSFGVGWVRAPPYDWQQGLQDPLRLEQWLQGVGRLGTSPSPTGSGGRR
jgi:hypothetical protein